MYSYEQRKKDVELYIKFDMSAWRMRTEFYVTTTSLPNQIKTPRLSHNLSILKMLR